MEEGNDLLEGCEWIYRCPLSFDQLERGSDDNVRYCNVCSKNVYNVTTEQDLQQKVNGGHCVAINSPTASLLTDFKYPVMGSMVYIPEIDPLDCWIEDEDQ